MFSLVGIFLFTAYLDIRYDDLFKASTAFDSYVSLFWLFSYGLIAGMAYVYYTFTKDKSETLAFISGYLILLYTGLHDLIYYILKQQSLPLAMDHLFKHPVMGRIAEIMGQTTVTPQVLMVSVSLGLIITYYTIKKLKEI